MTAADMFAMKRAANSMAWWSGYCSAGTHAHCRKGYNRLIPPVGWVDCACECHQDSVAAAPSSLTAAMDQNPAGSDSTASPLDLTPGSPAWSSRITASKVAPILGVSPWESQRSVWHQMHGDLPREESNDAMKRGHYLEPAILAWWRDRHPDYATHASQPTYTMGDWAAATPDMVAHRSAADMVLVEAKSAAHDDDWGDPGTDVIPTYYLCQVYWQMHVSGVRRCYVPIIGPRLKFAEYVVDYDPAIGADLERRMRAFYDSLSADEPPPLDDSVATFDAIRKLHKDIERGESVELTALQAWALVDRHHALKALGANARGIKSEVIAAMGRAQYATHNGVRIARRQPRGEDVTFVVVAKPEDLTSQGDAA